LRTPCGDGVVRSFELSRFLIQERKPPEQAFVLHIAHLQSSTRPWGLQVHLLGPILVRRADGEQVQGPGWRRAKVRALLGILVLRAGQPVHRECLLEMLWSDLDYEAALHNLNSTVYELRRSLKNLEEQGAPLTRIRYESNHYSLHWSSEDWLDTTTFENEIAWARGAPTHEDAARHYETALDLYRGDLLDDVILVFHDDACLREQARLRDLYLTAMAEFGALFQQMNQEKKAVDIYRRLLTLDPCREKACRQLMKLSLRQGDRTTALTHYKQLQKALSSEIGVQPEEETRRLYEQACAT
jgi:DNA-binding SARP family transcriptional activator